MPHDELASNGSGDDGEPIGSNLLAGKYQVEQVVSRSAREVVVQAVHLELEQRVLLRYLPAEANPSPEIVARFQRGARKAREMRSEHAERVVDFGRLESGMPYRASELPEGPSLAEILRVRGPLPVTEAVDIVIAACEPIAEAHAARIVHRSLGTSNVYVERRPDGSSLVRVLDFGVADPLEPEWGNGEEPTRFAPVAMSESLPYVAPEQVRTPGTLDPRSDVWALGAILHELVAGEPVFHAENALSLLAMISADVPVPLGMFRDDVPPELEGLVLSCLEKDPDARPRSVVELVSQLSAFASAEAQAAAARVARIVTRATRPPPLAGSVRPPVSVGARFSRPSHAVVHTRPPSSTPKSSRSSNDIPRGPALVIVGASVGVAAAALTFALGRPTPAQPVPVVTPPVAAAAPVLPAVASPAPAQAVVATTTPQSALVAPAPTVAALPVSQRAPAPAAVRPAPVPRAAVPAREARTAGEATLGVKKASAADEAGAEKKPVAVAAPHSLFSGMD